MARSKRTTQFITGSTLALFGAAAAGAEVPAALRNSLVQEIDFKFARTHSYKYGGDLTLAENPRTTLPGCTFGCDGQTYDVILFNEQIEAGNTAWIQDGGQGNVSSKGLVAKLNVREDNRAPEIEMVRNDGQCQIQRCMFGVSDLSDFEQSLEQMEIKFRRAGAGVNNLETLTDADRRTYMTNEAESLGVQAQNLGDTLRLTPQQQRIWDDYKTVMGFGADPKGFSYLRVRAAQGEILTIERAIYKGQPDDEGFNGRKDLLGVEVILTNAGLNANGDIFGKRNSVVHYFESINAETVGQGWYGESFVRSQGPNGLTQKRGKIDVRGESTGGDPYRKVAVEFNMEEYPAFCGQHAYFTNPGDACVDDKFQVGLLGDTVCVTVDYDALAFPPQHAGRARVRQSISAPGISSFEADFFDRANVEVLGKALDAGDRVWMFLNATTNVGVSINAYYLPTGTLKTYMSPSGTDFKAVLDTSAFIKP